MSIDVTTEKRFESDIEEFFLSPAGGYTHNQDAYDSQLGVYKDTLLRFIQKTQPKEWKRFLLQNKVDPERKFCLAFNNACDMDGLISVLRHGFKHRGIPFKVCYFKPESGLNQTAMSLYEENEITCNRQWFYSNDTHNSVDMVLAVNGIPVFEQIVRVCAEKDKLMSVHLRRAEEEAISILKKYRPRRCIIHWFNGNGEQLQQLVDIGCYFSLNSNMVTNEKNKEKLYLIPKTRVLIESDGPFTKIDGKKYTFNNLIKIYELVARYYNEPDIIKMVYANFRDILSK